MQLGKRFSSIRKRLAGNLPDPTETIRGSVVKYYLACGKQACRCHQGGPKHGPYYYLMTTLKPGKTRMVKLSPEQIKVVQTWVRNFKNYKKGLEKISQLNTRILQLDRKSEPGKSKRKRG
jgi:hypothetical protein